MLTPFQTRAMRTLGESPFFAELPEECLRWVHRTSVRKGELLFEKDSPSDHLYGLVGGLLKLTSRGSMRLRLLLGMGGREMRRNA